MHTYIYRYIHTCAAILQVEAIMAKLDGDRSGAVDQNEFVHALLPAKYYSLSANDSELRDPEAVGVAEGKLSGVN
jgi:hypothetical protein